MRPLEILILLLNALFLSSRLLHPFWPNRWTLWLPGLAGLVTIAHLLAEGYRWQMVPAYLFTFSLILSVVRYWLPDAPQLEGGRIAALAGALGLLILVPISALPWLIPIPQPLKPTGPYPVGTQSFYFTDPSRPEIYSDDPDDKRELMVQLWYPAAPTTSSEPAPYMNNLEIAIPELGERFNLPTFALRHLNLVRTHSLVEAPLAPEGPFPVLFFSSGWAGLRIQNTFQAETLASHGYVVVSADYPYDSIFITMPDGRVIFNDAQTVLPPDEPREVAGRRLVGVRVADTNFILERLAEWQADEDSIFYGQLDLERLGIFGHSTGGGTAVHFCAQEARCQAALALDGWLETLPLPLHDDALNFPTMFINTTEWLWSENQALGQQLYASAAAPTYQLTLSGANHYNFSDLPLLSPLTTVLGLTGEINGRRALHIINDYTLAFFNHHLRNEPAPLLNTPSPYPELTKENHNN